MMVDFSAVDRGSVAGQVLRTLLRLIPGRAIVPVLQGPLRGALWIKGSSVNGTWLGSYEAAKQRRFAESVSRGDVVLDLGANVGFYTLLASRLVGSHGLVIAMEPLPYNVRILYAHLGLNGVSNVAVLPYAAAETDGDMDFDPGNNNSMGRLREGGSIRVRAIRLDDVFTGDHVPTPTVVKMDIEGAEAAALAGGERFFREARPKIFLATHGRDVHARCVAMLRSWGYRIEPIESGAHVDNTDELFAFAPERRAG